MDSSTIPHFENYVPVSKNCLMKIFGEITFDLFIYPSGQKKLKKPVLLLRKNTLLPDKKEIFTERNFAGFFIRKNELGNFHRLLENYINMVIDDAYMPIQEKSELIYNCAQYVMQDIFEDPRSGENIQRAKDITSTIIQFALKDNASIPSLLRLSSHDYYTFTHCLNVAVFSIGLWQAIFPGQKQELQDFALGCILHDIGKSLIDDAILNKPGALSVGEFSIIKRHPQYGYDLMKDAVKDLSLDVILHHHEKHDGRGYPEGLKGDRISDPVKIAAIADVYDALTTQRAYADARDPFKAILTMKEEMVGHFEQEKFISFIHLLSGKKAPVS